MPLLTSVSAALRVQARVFLSQVLQMPERDIEDEIRAIESAEDFRSLKDFGVLKLNPYSEARWASRRFAGRELCAPDSALPELLNGRGNLARLIKQVGQERFEKCFLKENILSDEARSRICGISPKEVRELRQLIDDIYIQGEFSAAAPLSSPPAQVYSVVAGIEIENSRPALAFFHRDIWKGRYEIDSAKKAELLRILPKSRRREMELFILRLELIERRKSTLYKTLEALIEFQSDYLVSGNLEKRCPLTQRAVAARLGVSPSVINALISNKAVQLPWGLEAPLKSLMPSAKSILLCRLYDLAEEYPAFSDAKLSDLLRRLYGAELSRRSVAQYRSELGIGGTGDGAATMLKYDGHYPGQGSKSPENSKTA
jgi:hypothetical protein